MFNGDEWLNIRARRVKLGIKYTYTYIDFVCNAVCELTITNMATIKHFLVISDQIGVDRICASAINSRKLPKRKVYSACSNWKYLL